MDSLRRILGAVVAVSAIVMAATAGAQDVKHYRFAYDQPKPTGYGILGDIFSDKLKELSKGTMLIDQYPGAQLGQEPQVLQLLKAGDIEFCLSASANAATLFPAYGAQIVHMPFGSVYTSLQTGVVDAAENGVNVYLVNKHYEVAPVLSMTEHEANNNLIWVSDKTWNSLTPEQQKWVQAAADEVSKKEPALALKLEKDSADKLKTMGVKVVENVDKTAFIKAASPIQDQLAAELGPHAVKLLQLVRDVK